MPSRSPSVTPPGERFEVRGKLGAGGLGVVYRAFDRQRGAEVALKTLREVTGADLYRFKREFRSLADLVHPNLVRLHELHTVGDEWLLTMELVEGVPFSEWVRPGSSAPADAPRSPSARLLDATGPTAATPRAPLARQRLIAAPLDVARLEDAFYQLVDTVHALHQTGKLHRDLKPSNVLVETSGRVVVLDFGLVADLSAAPDLTHTSAAVGTPAYMSPEQYQDRPLGPATDWYSVGVMLYEALTGRRPFDVTQADQRTPAPHALNPDAPERLAALCQRLLETDPARRPGGEELLAALGREASPASRQLVRSQSAPPFVGRAKELGLLRAALAEVHTGHGVAVFVRGVSGMGKTSLLRRFLDEVDEGTVVLRGRCYERESVPFKTLDAIVDALTTYLLSRSPTELDELVPKDATALARLFPVLLRVPSIAAPPTKSFLPPDPLELRQRAFGALRQLLAHIGERQPLVLAIDDVQWGDADSGTFFAELIHHPDAPAMLLLVSHRSEDEDVTPLLSALRRSRDALGGAPTPVPIREITLGPLAEDEARQILGEGVWTARAMREAGGSPIFLSELARAHDEQRLGEEVSLEGMLTARIARLPDDARALLGVVAVAARPLSASTALAAAGLSGEGSVVTALVAARLLRSRRSDHARFLETYHDRIRSAAVARLAPDELRRVHAALATALEAQAEPDHEALVEHWREAGEPLRSAAHAAPAAAGAAARLAFHQAADLYAAALEDRRLSADEQRALRTRLGHALTHAGRLDEAAEAFGAAAVGAPADERLELARFELEQLVRGGQLQVGLEKAHVVLAEVGQSLPRTSLGAIATLVLHRLSIQFRRLDKKDIVPRQDPLPADQVRKLDVLWSVSSALGFVSPILGQTLQMRYLRTALAAREERHLGLALSIELVYLGIGGTRNRERIEALRQKSYALAQRHESAHVRGVSVASIGVSSYLCGRWSESAAQLDEGLRVLRDECTDVRWLVDMTEHFYISALWYLGELKQFVHLMPGLLRAAEERGDAFALRGLRGWRGNFYWLVIDQPDEARVQARSVATPRVGRAQLAHYYELLVETQLELYVGDAAAAHARVESSWPELERAMLLRVQNCFVEGWLLRARAALALAAVDAGRRPQLLKLALRAARQIDSQETHWGAPMAQLVRATVAHLRGEAGEAEDGLRAALAGFEAADMGLFADVVRCRLGVPSGESRLRAQAVVAPQKLLRMLAPGW